VMCSANQLTLLIYNTSALYYMTVGNDIN